MGEQSRRGSVDDRATGGAGRTALLLVAAVTVGLLALGGATEGAAIAIASVVAVAAIEGALHPRRRRGRAADLAVKLVWAHAAIVWLQLVPLPPRVLEIVSHRAAEIWSGADALVGQPRAWRPVSIDPPATLFAAATATTIAVFFDLATRTASRTAGRFQLLRGLVVAIAIFAAVTLLQSLAGASKILGVYTPRQPLPDLLLVSTLVNPNHLAAVLGVAPPLLAGFALERGAGADRSILLAAAIAAGVLGILALSRGGMVVLALEAVAIIAYATLRRRSLRQRFSAAASGFAAAAITVAAAVYVGVERVLPEVHDTRLDKLKVAVRALPIARDYPLAGVGRGAFGAAFPAYEGPPRDLGVATASHVFVHAESWPVQLGVDLGPLLAGALVLGFVVVLARSARPALRRPTTAGALIAFVGLVVHDLVDFSTELLGVGLLGIGLLAVVTTAARDDDEQRPGSVDSPKRRAVRRWGRVVAVVASIAALAVTAGRRLEQDFTAASSRQADPSPAAIAALDAAILRHPAEPYFALLAGVRRLHDQTGAPFLLRAVRLGPWRAQTHFWLARWFATAGRPAQAWTEYRVAYRLNRHFVKPVLDDMLAASAPREEFLHLGRTAEETEWAAAALAAGGRDEDAASLDLVLIREHPPAVQAQARVVERARRHGDLPRARALARQLVTQAPKAPTGHLLLAALLEDPLEAEATLERALDVPVDDDLPILEALLRRRGTRVGIEVLTELRERHRTTLLTRGLGLTRSHVVLGEIEVARHRYHAAIAHFRDAAASSHDGLAYLDRVADLAERTGQVALASATVARLAAARPNDDGLVRRLARLREAQQRLPPAGTLP